MKTNTLIAVVIALVVVAGGFYFWSTQSASAPSGTAGINGSPNQGNLGGTDTGTPQQPAGSAQGDGTTVGQNLILGINTSAALGTYLSAYNGMTVYTYAPDTAGVSNCTGACAANWPPYTVASAADINVSSATAGTVGTITRADGSLQVTYNGHPLYFYIKDTAPGQTNGQGIGGVWYVVTP